MVDQMYENREHDRALGEIREIERAPLADRKEAQQHFFEVMRDDPAALGERLTWLFNGSYGYGQRIMARKILANPRLNRQAALTQLVAACEWRCPGVMAAEAWKKLGPGEKSTVGTVVENVIQAAELDLEENPDETYQGKRTNRPAGKAQAKRLAALDFYKGQRVQMHPATDAFMMGDRYGDVVKVGREKVHVKMDRSGKIRQVSPGNLQTV